MSTNNNHIIIDSEYAEVFESIIKIKTETSCANNIIVYTQNTPGQDKIIQTQTHTFVLPHDPTNSRRQASQVLEFTEDGATWFEQLRTGKSANDGTAEWNSLIDTVKENFRRQYSFVECEQKDIGKRFDVKIADYEKQLIRLLDLLSDGDGSSYVLGRGDAHSEDIYCISLRIELSGGAGQDVPVLSKVYFRKNEGVFSPIISDEGKQIGENLSSVGDENAHSTFSSESTIEVIDGALRALEHLIKGEMSLSFTQAVCFSNKRDIDEVSRLRENSAHDNSTLECHRVEVIGISHVKWRSPSFVVYRDNARVMRATFGLSGSVSLLCLNCGNEMVSNSHIICEFKDDEGNEIELIPLDMSKSDVDFGLNTFAENYSFANGLISKIKKDGPLAHHLNPCKHAKEPGVNCDRCICKSDRTKVCWYPLDGVSTEESGAEGIYLCKDCPHPKVVFFDGRDNDRKYFSNLVFARDKLTMKPQADTEICACCGRRFTTDHLKTEGASKICQFCYTARNSSDNKDAQKLYKRYQGVFSPAQRLKYAGKAKACFEQYDIILFVMGDDCYVINKTDINKRGYLAKPISTKPING